MNIEIKKAHAAALCTQLTELQELIDSQPGLWFGGLPPLFLNLRVALASHDNLLKEKFELETV